MIEARNADVDAVAVSAVEDKPLYGGDMLIKPLRKGDQMTFVEIHYAAGAPFSQYEMRTSSHEPGEQLTTLEKPS